MNCEIVDGVKIWRKKNPPRGSKDKKYYIPTYGTPECSYVGKKRGRKPQGSQEGKEKLIFKKGEFILYFS